MLVIVGVCLLVGWGIVDEARSVHADTFQWMDENGTAGFTDNVLTVPRQHRDGLVTRQAREPSSSAAVPSYSSVLSGNRQKEELASDATIREQSEEEEIASEDGIGDTKRWWKERLRGAKATIVDLRAYRNTLEKKINETQHGMWLTFGPGASDFEKRSDMPRIEKEMRDVEEEINQLEHEVSVVIPAEARRAGIPPGWFR